MKILRATLKEVVCSLIVSQNKVCYLIMLFNLFMWIADYLSRAANEFSQNHPDTETSPEGRSIGYVRDKSGAR